MNDQSSKEDFTLTKPLTQAKDEVKNTAREAKETIKTKTKEVVAQAKEYGGEYAQHGKEQAANRIRGFSESMRQTANRFEQEEDPNIARYTRLLAEKLENAATYVRERDLKQLQEDGEKLARQHPAVFFGGMFVVGLAAARFLKASADRQEWPEEPEAGENFGAAEKIVAESDESTARRAEQEGESHQSAPAM